MPTVAGKRRLNATPAGGQRRHGRDRQRVVRRAVPDPHLDLDEHHEHDGDHAVDPQRVEPRAACEGEQSKHFVKSRPRRAALSSAAAADPGDARDRPTGSEQDRPTPRRFSGVPGVASRCQHERSSSDERTHARPSVRRPGDRLGRTRTRGPVHRHRSRGTVRHARQQQREGRERAREAGWHRASGSARTSRCSASAPSSRSRPG